MSGQERTILELSMTGLTSTDIAAVLHVPADEVRAHIRAACVALGARSKLEAVVIAASVGLIQLQDDQSRLGLAVQ